MPLSQFIPNSIGISSTIRLYSTANQPPCHHAQNQKKKSEEINEAEAEEMSDVSGLSRRFCVISRTKNINGGREVPPFAFLQEFKQVIANTFRKPQTLKCPAPGNFKPSVSDHQHLSHQHLIKTVVRGLIDGDIFHEDLKVTSSSAGQLDIVKLN